MKSADGVVRNKEKEIVRALYDPTVRRDIQPVLRDYGHPVPRCPPPHPSTREALSRSARLNEEPPETLKSVRTRSLFVLRLESNMLVVGSTPNTHRRVGEVSGGSFEGERLSGKVLDGDSNWQTVRKDGSTTLEVRLVLQTAEGDLVRMTYGGVRHGPPELLARIERGETVDPMSYYFRINPLFETASSRYDWLNRIETVGIGHRRAGGPSYSLFEAL